MLFKKSELNVFVNLVSLYIEEMYDKHYAVRGTTKDHKAFIVTVMDT